jgi:pimeloyl-ACP methyl ester carboxylesterase
LLAPLACTSTNQDYCGVSGMCDGGSGEDSSSEPVDLTSTGDQATADLAVKPDGGGVSVDPGLPGPRKTVSFDIQVAVTGGNTQGTVIGPSDDGATISLRGAPFPTVVLSPGFFQDRKKYQSYGQRLASYGIVTVLQKVPNEFDHAKYRDNTIELIDWLLKPSSPAGDKVKGRVDGSRLGLAGHSLGGKVSILAAAKDTRVKALFAIDPVDLNTPPSAPEIGKIHLPASLPIGFLGETTNKTGAFMPCAPAGSNFEALYDKASPPAFAINFLGAAHLDFTDMCDAGCASLCPGGTAPRDRTNSLAIKYATAYFLWGLGGDSAVHKYLDGSELQKDVAAGYVTRVGK